MVNDDFDSMVLAFSKGDDESDDDFYPQEMQSMMNSVMSDTAKSIRSNNREKE